MRILWLSPFHEGLHGVRWTVHGLAAALARRGHQTALVTRRPKRLARGLHAIEEEADGLRVWRVAMRPLPAGRPWSRAALSLPRTAAELRKVAAAERPDVLHAHGLRTQDLGASYAAQVILLKLLTRRPLVVHFHGVPPGSKTPPSALDRLAIRSAALVLGGAGEVLDYLRRTFPEARLALLPVGCDPGATSAAGERDGEYLLAAGRLAPEKGFDVLLDAFARIAPETPGLELRIAGDGPEQRALLARRAALGLDDRVRFLGALERPALLALYENARAVVCPSRQDSGPLVLLEAMAAARPVVATAVGLGRTLVVPGVSGLLAPPGDAAALASAMRDCLRDPAARRAMAARAREAVLAHHTWDAVAGELLRLYGEAGVTGHST